ncbi:MAG: 3-deoxy-D-manno-octulosonate 8-phosphate phosphatase (KDO 8-P phosphatase) [Patiriisocius sp.]|jgi:3-deoxy-D-manno-octulosonate 8-phosphate phosphatase (KDO 8-P phosphatase)
MEKNYKEILKKVDTLIFDFDGIFTDGTAILIEGQPPLRSCHARDTYAVQLAVKKGYRVAVITGGSSNEVKDRFLDLGVTDVFLKSHNKLLVYTQYCEDHKINDDTVLYMGDDIPDYRVMQKVGLPCCPSDAAMEIKSVAKYISHIPGGKGCVREIIEQVLRVKGLWFDDEAHLW